jgi:hypothetical protein
LGALGNERRRKKQEQKNEQYQGTRHAQITRIRHRFKFLF